VRFRFDLSQSPSVGYPHYPRNSLFYGVLLKLRSAAEYGSVSHRLPGIRMITRITILIVLK